MVTPVNLVIMVILLIFGKLANSYESVDLGESLNSGESENCCESIDSEKNLLILMRLMILFTLEILVILVNMANIVREGVKNKKKYFPRTLS